MHGHAVLLFREGPNELLTGTMSQWKPTPTKIKNSIWMPLENIFGIYTWCVWYAERRLRWLSQRKGTRLRFSCTAINVFGKKNLFLFLLIAHFHKLCRDNQPLRPSPLKTSLSISLTCFCTQSPCALSWVEAARKWLCWAAQPQTTLSRGGENIHILYFSGSTDTCVKKKYFGKTKSSTLLLK